MNCRVESERSLTRIRAGLAGQREVMSMSLPGMHVSPATSGNALVVCSIPASARTQWPFGGYCRVNSSPEPLTNGLGPQVLTFSEERANPDLCAIRVAAEENQGGLACSTRVYGMVRLRD